MKAVNDAITKYGEVCALIQEAFTPCAHSIQAYETFVERRGGAIAVARTVAQTAMWLCDLTGPTLALTGEPDSCDLYEATAGAAEGLLAGLTPQCAAAQGVHRGNEVWK